MENQPPKKNNVWVDGCFDLFHFGHANFLRVARSYGIRLTVGVHSDSEIIKHKGMPVLFLTERKYILQSIKWVDKVIVDAPYITDVELVKKHNCDLVIHGDDQPPTCDGSDSYESVKNAGIFEQINRTQGISTTLLAKSMIATKPSQKTQQSPSKYLVDLFHSINNETIRFGGKKNIVYVAGCFELIHPYLIKYLSEIKKSGNYLLVGLYADEIMVNQVNYKPILNVYERAIPILSLKCVNGVLIDAPFTMTPDFISKNKITSIFFGDCDLQKAERKLKYHCCMKTHVVRQDPPLALRCDFIFQRIQVNRSHFEQKIEKSEKSDREQVSTIKIA